MHNTYIVKGQNRIKKDGIFNVIAVTPGEVLWLERQRAGLGVEEAAARRGISADTYHAAERDKRRWGGLLPIRPSQLSEARVTDGEFVALQRRRRGWTAQLAADAVGVSRMTLWKAEHDKTLGVQRVKKWYLHHGVMHAVPNVPEEFEEAETA